MTLVSAVIPTRGRPEPVAVAARSVLANRFPSFEVVVCDQSDDEGTAEVVHGLMREHANLRYVRLSRAGASRARNAGARASSGELIAFTDDDCVARPDWLDSIVMAFASEPGIGALYGEVRLPRALVGQAGEVPTLRIPRRKRISRRDGFQIYGMSANFAVRRELFERLGGFDEALGVGGPLWSGEDFDFQYRAYLAGATVLLEPRAAVEHYGLRAPEEWPSTLRRYGFGDGAFYLKHIRCGDLFALVLLLRRLARLAASAARDALLGRSSGAVYLRAHFEGIRESMRFAVDRERRMYRAGPRLASVS